MNNGLSTDSQFAIFLDILVNKSPFWLDGVILMHDNQVVR